MFSPYSYPALIAILLAAVLLVRWIATRRKLMEDARLEYEERLELKPRTVKGVDARTFEKLYLGAFEPRWTLYTAATLIGAIAITAPAAIGLMLLWPIIVLGLDGGPWYDVGYYPWMFYMFFGMCFSWAFVAYIAARLHHQRRPEPFQPALARARGEPLDDVVIPRKRPAWAKRARPAATSAVSAEKTAHDTNKHRDKNPDQAASKDTE